MFFIGFFFGLVVSQSTSTTTGLVFRYALPRDVAPHVSTSTFTFRPPEPRGTRGAPGERGPPLRPVAALQEDRRQL